MATTTRGHRAGRDAGPGATGTGLVDRVRAALGPTAEDARERRWELHTDDFWCTVRPVEHIARAQGWKIHVSARTGDAPRVLDRVCDVLLPHRVAFKFAAGLDSLRMLNSREADRASAGKFITVYPDDDAQFGVLAAALDEATRGYAGPGILSDRPVRPGGVVHYRYGGFAHRSVLGNDGAYRAVVTAPDGALIDDSRQAWFTPPAWAPDPLAPSGGAPAASSASPAQSAPRGPAASPARPARVLVGGRFAVTAAIRHSAKGGVFRGVDTVGGGEVVLKQARAHIEVDRSGRDACAALRHEAAMLVRLAHTGLTPRHIATHAEAGSVFLAQERVAGVSLRAWVTERVGRSGRVDVPWDDARPVVAGLIRLLATMHAEGLAVRDLSATNVLVTPEGGLRLVDLELAADIGTRAGAAGTPGYRAPEQRAGGATEDGTHHVSPAADLYSLGGLLFLLATGADPVLPEDVGADRSTTGRLGAWLTLAARHGGTARRLAPAIRGLWADVPAERWALDRMRNFLAELAADSAGPACPAAAGAPEGGPGAPDPVLTEGLLHLAATMTPGRTDRLWPMTAGAAAMDPCAVQYGAAGVLGVLARAAHTPTLDPGLRHTLHSAVEAGASWLLRRATAEPVVLPGLHFGRSGTAWALYEAAGLLGDPALAAEAVRLALAVPVTWPNPDVCHGAAGAGLTQLRMWSATGDERFRARIAECADGLLGAARVKDDLTVWPVPSGFESTLAGAVHLGFAHGVAGVGAFLLAAARVTGREEHLDAARAAGRTLLLTVRDDDGAAWWPQSPGDPPGVRLAHWCSGSSGAGTFLVRLWETTGEAAYREAAQRAAVAVHRARWHSGTTACHGLAGNGEFLLDLAERTGDPAHRAAAAGLAEVLRTRTAEIDGLRVPADETSVGVSAGYGTGAAGVLAFLLRVRHAGPRLWLDTDEPMPAGAVTAATAAACAPAARSSAHHSSREPSAGCPAEAPTRPGLPGRSL